MDEEMLDFEMKRLSIELEREDSRFIELKAKQEIYSNAISSIFDDIHGLYSNTGDPEIQSKFNKLMEMFDIYNNLIIEISKEADKLGLTSSP